MIKFLPFFFFSLSAKVDIDNKQDKCPYTKFAQPPKNIGVHVNCEIAIFTFLKQMERPQKK